MQRMRLRLTSSSSNKPSPPDGDPLAIMRQDRASRLVRSCTSSPCRLPAVVIDANSYADAWCADAYAGARTVVPVAIGATLVIAVTRHSGVGVTHDHARAAMGTIAIAGVIADQPNLLNEIGAGVF